MEPESQTAGVCQPNPFAIGAHFPSGRIFRRDGCRRWSLKRPSHFPGGESLCRSQCSAAYVIIGRLNRRIGF